MNSRHRILAALAAAIFAFTVDAEAAPPRKQGAPMDGYAGRGDVRVEHHRISTPQQAEAVGFRGSPSVLVNGRDPFADADAPVGFTCRVYETDAGLAGAPTVEQLLAAVR